MTSLTPSEVSYPGHFPFSLFRASCLSSSAAALVPCPSTSSPLRDARWLARGEISFLFCQQEKEEITSFFFFSLFLSFPLPFSFLPFWEKACWFCFLCWFVLVDTTQAPVSGCVVWGEYVETPVPLAAISPFFFFSLSLAAVVTCFETKTQWQTPRSSSTLPLVRFFFSNALCCLCVLKLIAFRRR